MNSRVVFAGSFLVITATVLFLIQQPKHPGDTSVSSSESSYDTVDVLPQSEYLSAPIELSEEIIGDTETFPHQLDADLSSTLNRKDVEPEPVFVAVAKDEITRENIIIMPHVDAPADIEITPLTETELANNVAAYMDDAQLMAFIKLRQNLRVRNYNGALNSGYMYFGECVASASSGVCQRLIKHMSSEAIIFNGTTWVEGYQPTQVGEEVVKVRH